jgi:hypothetical protein
MTRMQEAGGRYASPRDPVVRALLYDPELREKVKKVAAMTSYNEAAGYVRMRAYLLEQGWDIDHIQALAKQYSAKGIINLALISDDVFFRWIGQGDHQDALWGAALVHVSEVLLRLENNMPSISVTEMQYAIYGFALQIEGIEGRAPIGVNGLAKLPFDPRTQTPPRNFLGYFREPAYYEPQQVIN